MLDKKKEISKEKIKRLRRGKNSNTGSKLCALTSKMERNQSTKLNLKSIELRK